MSKQKSFEQTVRAMSAADIIRAMVRGLRKPWVRVDMRTFGSAVHGACFGCAATNTICEINGKAFTKSSICDLGLRARFVKADIDFIDRFESDIDDLRTGILNVMRLDQLVGLPKPQEPLPRLSSYYTDADLAAYEAYADYVERCETKKPKRRAKAGV